MENWWCVLVVLALVACSSKPSEQQAQLARQIVEKSDVNVVALNKNLYQITPLLLRSEQLTAEDVPILEAHNVKTVVSLRFFTRNQNEHELPELKANLINKPLMSWHITPAEIADILYTIEQGQKQGAVLVHCYHGSDRTGLIIGMYRMVIQDWPIEHAKSEMVDGPYGFHTVWRNMPNMYNEQTVAEVRQHLQKLRQGT